MFPAVKFIFYPLTHAAAITVFFFSMHRYLRGERRPIRCALLMTALYVLCNGVIAKIFHFAFRSGEVHPWTDFLNPVFYFRPGFWGWLLAFLPLAFVVPFLVKLDRVGYFRGLALTLPLVIALQKVACFISGCCAGDVSDLPWAVVFPEGSGSRIEGVPVHPTQLYDMLLALSWYGILRALDRKERLRPYLFPAFLILYGVSRFLSEMLRPEFQQGFSDSQRLEVVAVTAVLLMLLFGRRLWLGVLRVGARKA